MANIADKFGKASVDNNYAVATTVKTARTAGTSVLAANDLSKFPTTTPAFFVTYKKTADPVTNESLITNQRSWKALVNPDNNTFTNLTLAPGYTDGDIAEGEFIEMIMTSQWGNSLVDGILVAHNQDGTLKTTAIPDGSVTTAKVADSAITAEKLSTSAITLGTAKSTSTFSSSSSAPTQLTGLTKTVTIPAGGRQIEIVANIGNITAGGLTTPMITIWDGAVGSGTQIGQSRGSTIAAAGYFTSTVCTALVEPSAGSKTYNVGVSNTAGISVDYAAALAAPQTLTVRAL